MITLKLKGTTNYGGSNIWACSNMEEQLFQFNTRHDDKLSAVFRKAHKRAKKFETFLALKRIKQLTGG